jgi:transcriptional regulator with AAA-type ATPase domain
MEIPGLALLAQQDPATARALQGLVQQLAMSLEAEQWASGRLAALRGSHTRTALLSLLVEEAKEQTGISEVWAVLWTGDIRHVVSFQTLVVSGKTGIVPAPEQISRTVVSEATRSQAPLWIDSPHTDLRFAKAESVVAGSSDTIGCLPIGTQGALYLSGLPAGGRVRSRSRLRLEALVRLAGLFLGDLPKQVPVGIPGLIGFTRPMQELFAAIRSFAPMPWPALVLGETGTGKEAVARALHSLSPRAEAPFLAINCAAIPESLAESLLFGHEKGAFTGADRRKDGIVERVRGGTLFLDEVGELPASVQSKLLRLLQEGRYERVGGEQELKFSGRVVAATLRSLDQIHGKEGFRSDLYYRLASCVLRVPPLRERREDIPALAQGLLSVACDQLKISGMQFSASALNLLGQQPWPGNVRELENSIKTAVARALVCGDNELLPSHFEINTESYNPEPLPSSGEGLLAATEAFQRRTVREALRQAGGNRQQAANQLGVSKQWLYRLLARWGGDA